MIQINSSVYGTLEVQNDQIYTFEAGILGLSDIKRYALFPMTDTSFFVLHAIEEQISFLLLPAHDAIEGYGFKVSSDVADLIEIGSDEEAVAMLIVNIHHNQLYVNLMAPILVNPHTMKGCQYVIKDQELSVRHPLQMVKEES